MQQSEFQRHFCVTVYISTQDRQHFLMLKHKKLGKWLPPGGHIEPNELPDEAACREVLEETGLKVNLIGEGFAKDNLLVRPFGVQRNIISHGTHEHIDLIYLAEAERSAAFSMDDNESMGIRWCNLTEIMDPSFDTFPATRDWISFFGRQSR